MRRKNRGTSPTCHAEIPFQGISLDWGFIVQRSKNSERYDKLKSINGNIAYLIIADHKTPYLDGVCAEDKTPPLPWLNQWFANHKPNLTTTLYVCVDQEGELYGHKEFRRLCTQWGYTIEPTAPYAPHQNSYGENPNLTIAHAITSLLQGAGLTNKFWDYAFHHFLFCNKHILHSGDDKTPYTQVTEKKADLSQLQTFGCRVWVRRENNINWMQTP